MWHGWVDDIKIIYNDWPYGIDKSIVHLCVWTKFPLDVDEEDPNGDLTPEMRGKIDAYVERTFGSRVPGENVSHTFFLAVITVWFGLVSLFGIMVLRRWLGFTDRFGRSSGSRTGRS